MLAIKKVRPDAIVPTRAYPTDAGADVYSAMTCIIPPRSRCVIPTGISVKLPAETYGRLAPRSGLAAQHGIDIGAGVIDQGFRGEIHVVVFNHSDNEFAVTHGDPIAHVIVERIVIPEIVEVGTLTLTERLLQ
jgi:dUTP pyrophosphatase